MKKVIVKQKDLSEFLIYCVHWGFKPKCINRFYEFQKEPTSFVFKLNKPFSELDFESVKESAPSLEKFKI